MPVKSLFVRSPDERPTINLEPGEFSAQVSLAIEALGKLGGLYVWGGRLAVLHTLGAPSPGAIHRPASAVLIVLVDASHLIELLSRAARFLKFDARSKDWREADPPRRLAEAILSRGFWPSLPALHGFVEAPTLSADAKLLDATGYHAQEGIFVAASPAGFESPPHKLTRRDAVTAIELLVKALDSFPFVDTMDEVAAVAEIITAVVRRSLESAPLFAHSAPSPGTGKTLLASVTSIIAVGRRPSVLSLGDDNAEAEKRLGGALLAGDPIIVLDNIERPLQGDLLCQITTEPAVRLRPLGVSSLMTVPTHSTLIATGNNLVVLGDLKRRVVLIRLDAKMERPELREFEVNVLAEVAKARAELLRAALTIPLAYHAAGEPYIEGVPPFGGFETWDRFVRRPLCWCGLPDPLAAAERLRDDDPDHQATREVFSAIRDIWGDRPATASDIVGSALETEQKMSGLFEPRYPALKDALQVVTSEKINSRRLGYWLKRHRDRICDGLQLRQAAPDSHAKVARWVVASAGEAGNGG